VVIVTSAEQIVNVTLCCSYKTYWCLCGFIYNLHILLLPFLLMLLELCKINSGMQCFILDLNFGHNR